MAQYADLTKDFGDRIVELVKPAQDITVDAVGAVSETVADLVPEVPLPENVPSAREVVEAGFDLWQQLVGAQREYVGRLFDALSPISEKFEAKEDAKPKVVKTASA
jgi:hypothetical protein